MVTLHRINRRLIWWWGADAQIEHQFADVHLVESRVVGLAVADGFDILAQVSCVLADQFQGLHVAMQVGIAQNKLPHRMVKAAVVAGNVTSHAIVSAIELVGCI